MELLATRVRDLRRLAIGAACAATIAPLVGARAASDARGALRLAWRADLAPCPGPLPRLGRCACVAATTRDRDCVLLRIQDGATLWRVRRHAGVSGGLAFAAGTVLGVTDAPEGQLFCLDRADGRERWRVPLGEAWEAPAVSDTAVFAASVGGEVKCLALRDGRTLWSYDAPAFVRARLARTGDLLLVPTQGDSLIALEADSGSVRWGLAPGGALYGGIVVAGGRAWCLSYEGNLTAFDVHSGEVRGRATCEGLFRAGLAGSDPLLALATDGRLYALDPHSLEILWRRELGAIGEVTPALDRETGLGRAAGWIGAGVARAGRYGMSRPYRCRRRSRAPIIPIDGSVIVGAGGGEVVSYSWFGGRTSSRNNAARPAIVPIGWTGGPGLVLRVSAWIVTSSSPRRMPATPRPTTRRASASSPLAVGERPQRRGAVGVDRGLGDRLGGRALDAAGGGPRLRRLPIPGSARCTRTGLGTRRALRPRGRGGVDRLGGMLRAHGAGVARSRLARAGSHEPRSRCMALARDLALAVVIVAGAACSGRERTNPFDPANSDAHGEPASLRAIAGCRRVDLTWDDLEMRDRTGYRVWRARPAGVESLLSRDAAESHGRSPMPTRARRTGFSTATASSTYSATLPGSARRCPRDRGPLCPGARTRAVGVWRC